MKIAGLQYAPVWEDKPANFARVQRAARLAAEHGVDWLVLPEMFATGFSLRPERTAEPEDGPTVTFLRELAQQLRLGLIGGVVLAGGGGKGRNSAVAVDERGALLASYAKTHLIGLLGEDAAHEAGDRPHPFSLDGHRAVCFVCYDLRFPELFRQVADDCALVCVIASWPDSRQRHWDLLLPARAVENQCYVIGVNRVGRGGGLAFRGGSAVYDPLGDCLAFAGSGEDLLMADIDLDRVASIREEMPFLADRRF
jgi:predicted amidohydrolase